MFKIGFDKKVIYLAEVFLYGILLTYTGLIVARIIDRFVKKIDQKINKNDKIKKHILTFIHIGLICLFCLVIRECIVFIGDSIIGYTWGDPSKYATVIMGSIMFSNSDILKNNIKLILEYYNLQ